MRRLRLLLCSVLLAVAYRSDALAQSCSGELLDRFEDTCRASYIEIDTRDEGRRRVHEGDEICFTPPKRREWTWYCRGYEEGARCSAKGNVAVSATMEGDLVVWKCYER